MTICTEKEAAEKWCPQGAGVATRVMIDESGRQWSVPGDYREARCIGSRCMAWRWAKDDETPDGNARGYCGAFGKVEP